MGMSLQGKENQHHCSLKNWDALLQLGCCYGWEPEERCWHRNDRYCYRTPHYLRNDGQFVNPSDADTLVAALERALNELNDNFAWIVNGPADEYPVLVTADMVYDARDTVEHISKESTISHGYLVRAIVEGPLCKFCIEDFIKFCRETDGFYIL